MDSDHGKKNGFSASTLLDAWNVSVRNNPDKIVIQDSHDIGYTYAEADRLANCIAAYLHDCGVEQGDIVSCQMPGWSEFLPIYIGTLKTGAALSPIPANLRFHELSHMLDRCGSKALFMPRSYRKYTYCGLAGELRQIQEKLHTTVVVDKYGEGSSLPTFDQIIQVYGSIKHKKLPQVSPQPDDLAVIIFTSGSEGNAKGVMLSNRNVLAAEKAFSDFFGITEKDIMFMPAPVAHAIGFHHGVTMPFLNGATCILQDHFNAPDAIELINRHHATVTMASTPFLHDLVQVMTSDGARMPSLRFFLCGGSPPNLSRVREAGELGLKVLNVYGATESVPHMGTRPDATEEQVSRQALFPMPGIEVKIVDREGQPVHDGAEGEEISHSDAVFHGYLNMPEATAATLKDGWYHSGDLCRRNPDGSYIITGRIKDIIVRGGENISCLELETILMRHANIGEASVVGMPDERLQERICAYVVLKDAQQPLGLKDVQEHFASCNVAKMKYPEHLIILDALPRTNSGKIDKKALAREIASKTGES